MSKSHTKLAFFLGTLIGVGAAILLHYYKSKDLHQLKGENENERNISWDSLRYSHLKPKTKAEYLFNTIPILCLILNSDSQSMNFSAISATWAKGCNEVVVVKLFRNKDEDNQTFSKDISKTWTNMCNALLEINAEEYPWILLTEEKVFVIMENLRFYIKSLNPVESHYLGYAKTFWNMPYNIARAGYVLSQAAFKSLQEVLKKEQCSTNSFLIYNNTDIYVGKKLHYLNITPVDTRDSKNCSRFFPSQIKIRPYCPSTLKVFKNSVYDSKCISHHVISFEMEEKNYFYYYYYYIYYLQPFETGHLGNKPFKSNQSVDYVWKEVLKEHNITHNVSTEEYAELWKELMDAEPEKYLIISNNNTNRYFLDHF